MTSSQLQVSLNPKVTSSSLDVLSLCDTPHESGFAYPQMNGINGTCTKLVSDSFRNHYYSPKGARPLCQADPIRCISCNDSLHRENVDGVP